MSSKQLAKLEIQLHNMQARQFRRTLSDRERQRLQQKVAWIKQRMATLRKAM